MPYWKKPTGAKSPRSRLIAKADRLLSELVRRSAADHNGMCKCVTCGKPGHWKEMDAGHYINRRHMATRYDLRNVHVQCRSCNRFEEGRAHDHALWIDRTYGGISGVPTSEYLRQIAMAPGKYGELWLQSVISELKEKIRGIH